MLRIECQLASLIKTQNLGKGVALEGQLLFLFPYVEDGISFRD